MVVGVIVAIVVVFVLLYCIAIYNNLIRLLNLAKNAFAQIDVQLKRRYDLIPNLIEVAKKYLSHEEQTLLKVIEARNIAKTALDSAQTNNLKAGAMDALSKAEKNLTGALQGLHITLEAYPNLKANENMIQLSEELSSTENKIAFARQAYNDSVMSYNTYKQSFPNVCIANIFARFQQDLGMLEFDEPREMLNKAPKIEF